MFERLIKRGSSLIKRLEVVSTAYKDRTFDQLTASQNVNWTEIDGWYDATSKLIIEAFGEKSDELKKWKKKLNEIDVRQSKAYQIEKAVDNVIEKIHTMRGILIEFEDIWQAQRSKDSGLNNHDDTNGVSKAPTRPPLTYRLIIGALAFMAGIGVLFIPLVQSWEWLQNHPNKLGLYLVFLRKQLNFEIKAVVSSFFLSMLATSDDRCLIFLVGRTNFL